MEHMDQKLIAEYPIRRISPVDGMAVTAEVWEEAHRYHREQQRFHALLNHGSGILTGLEVIASDPPDSAVYILPGIAVDSLGQTIILPEPTAFDVGTAQGLLYLLLSYGESQPRIEEDREGAPRYVRAQFGIEATDTLPDTSFVELARIRRQGRDSPLTNARDATQPLANEVDLRFRPEVGVAGRQPLSLAVSYAGGPAGRRHGRGAANLARALRRSGRQVWMDDAVPLAPGLERYALVYLVGHDAFQLSRDEMNALYACLQAGGTVLVESCRHDLQDGEPASDAAFADLLASMGVQLQELGAEHPLLQEPFLFSAPPAGFETEGTPQIQVGGGVIFSTYDYGCLWRGERRGTPASRAEIRTAMEWGSNLMAYAMARRKQAGDRGEGP
jgi:hypothetical protein